MSRRPPDPAPEGFTWPGGARLALSIVVNVEEGAERRIDEGDGRPEPVDELGAVPGKPIRVHGNESNYLYGIHRGAPRVIRLLDEAGYAATWTVCGQALEKAPLAFLTMIQAMRPTPTSTWMPCSPVMVK